MTVLAAGDPDVEGGEKGKGRLRAYGRTATALAVRYKVQGSGIKLTDFVNTGAGGKDGSKMPWFGMVV